MHYIPVEMAIVTTFFMLALLACLIVWVISSIVIKYLPRTHKLKFQTIDPVINCEWCKTRIFNNICYDPITKLPMHSHCLNQLDTQVELNCLKLKAA